MDVWNLKGWYDFMLRGIFALGLIAALVLGCMQIFGWELTIGIPTIEHTFKHR